MKIRRSLNQWMAWTGYELVHSSKKRGIDWEHDIKQLFSNRTPGVVMDVGAHEGESIRRFRAMFPNASIYSFEPGEETFGRLHRNLRPADQKHVHLEQMALGAKNGAAELFMNARPATNSLLPLSQQVTTLLGKDILVPAGRSQVPVRTLDSFCEERRIERIDLLKIDVQGYELEVLRGAFDLLRGKRVRAIFLEVFFVPVYEGQAFFEDIYLFLKRADYRFSGLYDLSYQSDECPRWGDALFLA